MKTIILFGYPMDNSVRAVTVENDKEYEKAINEYTKIKYFICSFRATDIVTELSEAQKPQDKGEGEEKVR